MRYRRAGRQRLRALVAGLLLSLVAVPDLPAGEWESMRDAYDGKLKAQARRIAEIEARERGGSAGQEARADRITRDRISGIRASLPKGGGRGTGLADAAGKASRDAKALGDFRESRASISPSSLIEWGAEGTERRKLREVLAGLSNSLERASASLTRTTEIAETLPRHVSQSGVVRQDGQDRV